MHLIIVEDLALDQEKLADLIRRDCDGHGEHVDLSFYASGEDFLSHYRPKSCDGLFLDNRWKVLFLYLFVADYTMIVWGAAAFLEARFFYAPGAGFTSWKSVLFSLAVLAVTAPVMLHYLTAYGKKLPPDIRKTYTKNFSLNAVCTRYAEEARKYEIGYDVELDMPERLPINEPEICALLGNLLENAVDACREVRRSDPFIRVRGAWEDHHIVFAVDNSCEQEPVWRDGRLLSSKREGFGTGTWTIQKAAERCGGMAEFTYRDGVFYASVFLYR